MKDKDEPKKDDKKGEDDDECGRTASIEKVVGSLSIIAEVLDDDFGLEKSAFAIVKSMEILVKEACENCVQDADFNDAKDKDKKTEECKCPKCKCDPCECPKKEKKEDEDEDGKKKVE
jgi:hypothetical protein